MTDPYDADGMAAGGHAGSPLESSDDVIELEPFMRGGLVSATDAVPTITTVPCKGDCGDDSVHDSHLATAWAGAVMVPKDKAPGDTSDGYHTFDELYEHRKALTMVLATIAAIDGQSWRSKAHHPDDGPIFDGYFIVGLKLPTGPITYHYPIDAWDDFAGVPVLEHAPKWDGADADDTVYRLRGFTTHLRIAIEEGREAQEAARKAADAVVEASEHPDAHEESK